MLESSAEQLCGRVQTLDFEHLTSCLAGGEPNEPYSGYSVTNLKIILPVDRPRSIHSAPWRSYKDLSDLTWTQIGLEAERHFRLPSDGGHQDAS